MPRSGTLEAEGAGDYEEEIAPSPNMRMVLTRLHDLKMASPGGGSSTVSGPANHSKEGAALLAEELIKLAVGMIGLGR